MELEYFPCYHSYLDKVAKLSDQEVGRLFRALLRYSALGEAPELTGRESVAFDFIVYDIDRAKGSHEGKKQKYAQNARKRWDAKACNGIKRNANHAITITNTNTNTIIPPTPLSAEEELKAELKGKGFSPEMQDELSKWARYKVGLGDEYTDIGLEALLDRALAEVGKHGDNAVIELINTSMGNGWKGIIWDKLTESQRPVYAKKPEIPKGASGELGAAELEAIQRVLREG